MTHTPERHGQGRRKDDIVRFRFSLTRAALWVGLITAIAAGSSTIVGAITNRVVTPGNLKPVRDSLNTIALQQDLTTQALVRLNLRIDSVNMALAQFADIAETMAIDICLRRQGNPYALRKLNCERYDIGGRP